MSLFPFEYPDFTQVLPMEHHTCYSILLIRAMNISILLFFVLAVFRNKPSLPDLLGSLPGFPEVVKLLRQVKLKPGLFTFFVFLLCLASHQEFEVYAANSNFSLCKTKLLA